MVVYRIVLTDDREHEDFVKSFMSRSALGLPPRSGTPEERHPSLADGISVYKTREAAAATSIATKLRLGNFVAEIPLSGGMGIEIAEWGQRGHLTTWADALILTRIAVDILVIEAI